MPYIEYAAHIPQPLNTRPRGKPQSIFREQPKPRHCCEAADGGSYGVT